MNDNGKNQLLELIRAYTVENGGNRLAAQLLGISPDLLRAIRRGKREISENTADKFGWELVTVRVYRPKSAALPAAPVPFAGDAIISKTMAEQG